VGALLLTAVVLSIIGRMLLLLIQGRYRFCFVLLCFVLDKSIKQTNKEAPTQICKKNNYNTLVEESIM
jgi:hypothetical protein